MQQTLTLYIENAVTGRSAVPGDVQSQPKIGRSQRLPHTPRYTAFAFRHAGRLWHNQSCDVEFVAPRRTGILEFRRVLQLPTMRFARFQKSVISFLPRRLETFDRKLSSPCISNGGTPFEL
jgi:hypothetical protein